MLTKDQLAHAKILRMWAMLLEGEPVQGALMGYGMQELRPKVILDAAAKELRILKKLYI